MAEGAMSSLTLHKSSQPTWYTNQSNLNSFVQICVLASAGQRAL